MSPAHALLPLAGAALALLPSPAWAQGTAERTVTIGVLGMAGGAVEALAAYGDELNVRVSALRPGSFAATPPPDLSAFDVVLTSFASGELKQHYQRAVRAALARNPELKIFCVAPPPICEMWADWIGQEHLRVDRQLAGYYGLSRESMKEMLRYLLITYLGREGTVAPPGAGPPPVRVFHPTYSELESVADFLARSREAGRDIEQSPRVALGSWRHHVLFHQPKVIAALIEALEAEGMLAVCLVADAPGFAERLEEYAPDLVIMTSHTREPPAFWTKLGVPRLHALWFTHESIAEWQTSNQTGMTKASQFHQIVSSEIKGATETLAAGGTESGRDSGEEILPIPDRIARIVGRAKAWIRLRRTPNADKRVAIVGYDLEADKAGLLAGPAHNLNAPRSMLKLLGALRQAGYRLADVPATPEDLLARLVAHGRQMGSWEPGPLGRLARSGQAALVPEATYRRWFEAIVPEWRQQEVIQQWGPVPGDLMVWTHEGKRYLVLPKLGLGRVVLVTQPPKGETITASLNVQTPDESLLPPTHHYLATYFWLQHEYQADALVHFGSHGSEWLFPGKQAVNARADWSDMLIGDLPNVNPWLSSNTAEILPCKRRARAVTVDFMPPPLMEAGLPDELLNLESTIEKYETLPPGALRKEFAASLAGQITACALDRDLGIAPGPDGRFADADIQRVAKHLHDLGNELIPASMHVLGEPPASELRVPYLAHCLGKRFRTAARTLFPKHARAGDEAGLQDKIQEVLRRLLEQGQTPAQAIRQSGGRLPKGTLPEAVQEGLELARTMSADLDRTHLEIDRLLAALDGKFVAPGPSGSPERNPGVLPTGRNMYVLNPRELPTRASWELGARLIEEYLAAQHEARGRYPRKIAFSLVPFATYSDFGIIESQILRLIGVRPVWDAKNRVVDVEPIPAAELGRPRIDVFLSARSVYRDELPSMMRLLDRAIQLAASLDEPDNQVRAHSRATQLQLVAQGVPEARARALSNARMFGAKPEEIIDSHNWFFYLTERSGEWESREDLLDVYLDKSKYAYADGVWGELAPQAHDAAIRDTDLILRSWYDNRDFVLSNKFTWWVDGTLSLAIKHLTGQEPDYLFVDVRDPDDAALRDSTEVVQSDFRARLTNPRWIAGMMKEGYAGGNLIAKTADNLMGWEIMREASVADSNWDDLTEVYVRDSRDLGLRDWFDRTNPHAFQKLTVTLLETARKGFWAADAATTQEIAAAYADSVARHGPVGGPREGGNEKLEQYVAQQLAAAGTAELEALQERYRARMAEQRAPASATPPDAEPVTGKKLERVEERPDAPRVDDVVVLVIGCLALLAIGAGFVGHRPPGRRKGGR